MTNTQSCKESSAGAGEHLYGTVPRVDHWFLLEYNGHWEKDALQQSSIPEAVKNELNSLAQSKERSRIQLIQNENNNGSDISFYYVNSTEFEPKVYKFLLNSYEDLLELNMPELLEKGDINDSESDERLAIVCTHGAYDSCCGSYGVPVYNELSKNKDLTVWKTTHVGSHRFSANVVMLPEGVYYGRVNSDNVDNVISSHLENNIYLDCFRGRCCYSQTSQVCDFFLRNETKKYGIYDIRWEFERDRDANVTVEFLVENDNLLYTVSAIVLNNAFRIKTSCTDNETTAIHQFYFYSLIAIPPQEKKED